MKSARLATFLIGLTLALLGPGATGQDKGTKEDPKAEKKDDKKDDKGDGKGKGSLRGQLPQNWGKIGLTDDQKQGIYKLQAKHNEEIDKLETQIKEIKAKLVDERLKILTADQKKRLEGIAKAKSGTDK